MPTPVVERLRVLSVQQRDVFPMRSHRGAGEHLADELAARGMTAADLTRAMGVDAGRALQLVNAQVAVTGDTAIQLAEASGTSAEFWIHLQSNHDLARAREAPDPR